MVKFGVDTTKYPEIREERVSYLKIIRVSGDLRLAPKKVRVRLGSEMSPEQRRAQARQERNEEAQRMREFYRALEELLSTPPTDAQLALPKCVQGPVSPKALQLLGDDGLNAASLRQVPKGAKITPKVLKVLGCEPALLQPKARNIMFSPEERRQSTLSTGSQASTSSSTSSLTSMSSAIAAKFEVLRLRIMNSDVLLAFQRQVAMAA